MTTATHPPELAEPYLLGWLSSIGLDVEYVRGRGNVLFLREPDGTEVPVVDFVGGYGSLIFGHNHPDLVATAKELLDASSPVHAQFSRHPYANDVANALSAILQRELNIDEPFIAVFANSGAEAVEVAIKHAELDRVLRLGEIRAAITGNTAQARESVVAAAVVPDATSLARFGVTGSDPVTAFDALVAELDRHNDAVMQRPPQFLALEGSFHGKLAGSVQLTHSEAYRTPFKALAAQARFIPRDRPEAIAATVAQEPAHAFDVVVADGVARVVERRLPVFTAFLVEAIQGEGGINPITAEFAAELQRVCADFDCPVIVDEIQSGMGRTGAFLASSHIGLRGDYYTLAKSLGGGIAKTAVMLIRQHRHRPEFEFVHSSTFAKDSFSCGIALKVLEMLEAGDGRAYRLARERGDRMAAMLAAVRSAYPDVVRDVRGRGLMLGLEFADQSGAAAPAIREAAPLLGYVLAGYLLRKHRIRVFPTASNVNTLRFEPSVELLDSEIDQLESGLRAVCDLLHGQRGELLEVH
jgi:acetylornithine/succinyldiaminopimelate/putrescine aminotransferase